MSYVIGIDVGGTFTDVVCSDGETTWRAKSPTNPAIFSEGVLEGCRIVGKQIGVTLDELLVSTARFGLGTTAVTNVFASLVGHRVGLLTTAGFESEMQLARGARISEDGWLASPWNPVDEDCIRGVNERIDRNGKVKTPLSASEVEGYARDLVENHGVDAFAISFLWSFRQPKHENETAAIVRRLYPKMPVFCGAQLNPVMREYERTTLAVLSAFAGSALNGVEALETELKSLGLTAPVLLLHSGGGAISVAEARSAPVGLASSGPAAGAVAAAEVCAAINLENALCCDMGGTSVDVAVVRHGAPERRQRTEIHGIMTGQSAVDVESIGAGGGSIAWVDSRGVLRVGPKSARAMPGPACYGRGGVEATVTDAMLLLGYIDPAAVMGGKMALDRQAAFEACERLGAKVGLTAMETAFGIREIALAEMSKAIRSRLSSGGLDPRDFALVAFGGSGSLFCPPLAVEMGFASVLTPAVASVLSAYGAAIADIRIERRRAMDEVLPIDDARAAMIVAELSAQMDNDLAAQGVTPENREIICEADVHFYRQKSTLSLRIAPGELTSENLAERFRAAYVAMYGSSGLMAQSVVELSTLRIVGVGKTVRAVLPRDDEHQATEAPTKSSERAVQVARDKTIIVPVYRAETLRTGQVIAGPVLIDSVDTTLWAPVGSHVTLSGARSLITRMDN